MPNIDLTSAIQNIRPHSQLIATRLCKVKTAPTGKLENGFRDCTATLLHFCDRCLYRVGE